LWLPSTSETWVEQNPTTKTMLQQTTNGLSAVDRQHLSG
jgi:hypothetical protein